MSNSTVEGIKIGFLISIWICGLAILRQLVLINEILFAASS